MANFCAKCGAAMVAGAKFCPECGAPAAEPTGQRPAGAPPPPPPAAAGGAPAPAGAAAGTGLTPAVARFMCYLFGFITGLVFLNMDPHKNDPEVKFHAWQSIFFNIFMVAIWIVQWILAMIFFAIHLWFLISIIWWLVALGFLAVWILLMVKAYNGERFKLPIIGDLAEQQAAK